MREEVFGPVATVSPFDDIPEALRGANDTSFGLAAGVWTRDLDKAHAIARGVKAGTVWVNTFGINDAAVPFGGRGMNGYGREYGHAVLDEYTQRKSVWHATRSFEEDE